MTVMYGSKAEPIKLFGEDTQELKAFYEAAIRVAPGAWDLLQALLASWQSGALAHEWQLPDGYEAKVKVMVPQETRIEVQELDGASFKYQYYVNEGTERGLSNAANVVHSVDAYILRCIHRRCNYNSSLISYVKEVVEKTLYERFTHKSIQAEVTDRNLAYHLNLYAQSSMADVVVAPFITETNVNQLPTEYMEKLLGIILSMLAHKPFEVVTVHDEFKCHANNMNHLRQHYINVFAELADSTVLDMILTKIYGRKGTYQKLSQNLSDDIKKSNYALC